MKSAKLGFAITLLLMLFVPLSSADTFSFTFDENGNGSSTPFAPFTGVLLPDPSNGGALALTYLLPSSIVGSVFNGDGSICEDPSCSMVSDVIRFTDSSGSLSGKTADRLIFYSDDADGADALADTGFPANLNSGTAVTLGVEGNGVFTFTGTSGNTYNAISDVLEPSGLLLLGTGLLGLVGVRRKLLR